MDDFGGSPRRGPAGRGSRLARTCFFKGAWPLCVAGVGSVLREMLAACEEIRVVVRTPRPVFGS